MPTIRSRSAGNLPAVPSSIGHRTLSSWAGIRVHHTGGAFSSWRSIHDWQTAGRPPGDRLAYIGYSFGISSGDAWTLRGFDHHPAHDFINTHIGVVFGGKFETGLPRDEDLDALVWFVREAEERCQKRLPISTHREVGQTTCPGGRLHQWVKQTLPGRLKGDDDMPIDNKDANRVFRADGSIDAPGLAADGSKRDTSDNPTWAANSAIGAIYDNVARVRADLRVGLASAAADRAALAKLVEGLAGAVQLTPAQVDQLAAAVAEAGDTAAREVLDRLGAAGDALAGE